MDRSRFAALLTKPLKEAALVATLAELFPPGPAGRRDPGVRGDAAAAPATGLSPAAPAADHDPTTSALPLRILVAEDNPVNRKLALAMLERLGCCAEVVDNGRAAVDAVLADDASHYDVVIMDIQMPELDGLAATREILRRLPPPARRPRIVAMTANAMAGDRERCLAAGMDDYLTKPIRVDELTATLERCRSSPMR